MKVKIIFLSIFFLSLAFVGCAQKVDYSPNLKVFSEMKGIRCSVDINLDRAMEGNNYLSETTRDEGEYLYVEVFQGFLYVKFSSLKKQSDETIYKKDGYFYKESLGGGGMKDCDHDRDLISISLVFSKRKKLMHVTYTYK